MAQSPSQRRLAENEVLFRKQNEAVLNTVKKHAPQGTLDESFPYFYCECSSAFCMEKIAISPRRYEALHRTRKQFIIRPGHEKGTIERVIEETPEYYVVEKYETPPDPAESKLYKKA